MGTFGGALEARKVDASNKKLTANVTGKVGLVDGVLRINSINVKYTIKSKFDNKEIIERVHSMHKEYCPVYMSICGSIAISTEFIIV